MFGSAWNFNRDLAQSLAVYDHTFSQIILKPRDVDILKVPTDQRNACDVDVPPFS